MPVYEYRCKECNKDFEVRQKFSDDPVAECKFCSGPVEKLISRSSFALKGGGWYKDGYSASLKSKSPSCSDTNSSTTAKADSPKPDSAACNGCPAAGSGSD